MVCTAPAGTDTRTSSLCRCVDRDVARGIGSERVAEHVLPPLADLESGGTSHGVEFGNRAVANSPRPKPDASILGEFDELSFDDLVRRVVDIDRQHHAIGCEGPHAHGVSGGTPDIGNSGLDDECSVRFESAGDLGELASLDVGRSEAEQRVVGDVGDTERSGRQGIDHVSVDHVDGMKNDTDLRGSLAFLGTQTVQHGRTRIDPGDPSAGGREFERDATRSHPEFEERSVTSEAAKESDGRNDIADVAVPLVVHIGECVTIRRRLEALHGVDPVTFDGLGVGRNCTGRTVL